MVDSKTSQDFVICLKILELSKCSDRGMPKFALCLIHKLTRTYRSYMFLQNVFKFLNSN